MAKMALAVLESALRERKLDRTLSSAAPLPVHGGACTPTTIPSIDTCLKGGLPRGQLCELTGPQGAGRTTLALQLMAGVTSQGEIAAFIDTCDRLDVASAQAAGIDLDRLLWVRGYSTAQSDRANGASSALERALKALNLVLQAGGFSVVAIDLIDVPLAALKRLPLTTWMRLQRVVEGSETTCLLLASAPLARSAGGVTVALSGQPQWSGSGRSQRFSGISVAARMQSPRRYANGDATFGAVAVDA
jgi:hypothetical protein